MMAWLIRLRRSSSSTSFCSAMACSRVAVLFVPRHVEFRVLAGDVAVRAPDDEDERRVHGGEHQQHEAGEYSRLAPGPGQFGSDVGVDLQHAVRPALAHDGDVAGNDVAIDDDAFEGVDLALEGELADGLAQKRPNEGGVVPLVRADLVGVGGVDHHPVAVVGLDRDDHEALRQLLDGGVDVAGRGMGAQGFGVHGGDARQMIGETGPKAVGHGAGQDHVAGFRLGDQGLDVAQVQGGHDDDHGHADDRAPCQTEITPHTEHIQTPSEPGAVLVVLFLPQ